MDKVLSLRSVKMDNSADVLATRPAPAAVLAAARATARAASIVPSDAPEPCPSSEKFSPAGQSSASELDFSTASEEWQQTRKQLARLEKKLAAIKVLQRKAENTAHSLRVMESYNGLGPKVMEDLDLRCLFNMTERSSDKEQWPAFLTKLKAVKKKVKIIMVQRLGRRLDADENDRVQRIALIKTMTHWYAKRAHHIEKKAGTQGKAVMKLRQRERLCWRKTQEAKQRLFNARVSMPIPLRRPLQCSPLCHSSSDSD